MDPMAAAAVGHRRAGMMRVRMTEQAPTSDPTFEFSHFEARVARVRCCRMPFVQADFRCSIEEMSRPEWLAVPVPGRDIHQIP